MKAVCAVLAVCLVLVQCDKPLKTRDDLCRFLCSKAQGCPKSCDQYLNAWSKRSLTHGFDDYSFDDYLFMKLLGRNLQG